MDIKISSQNIKGSVLAPPSKSITHRAIILASLARGDAVIENALVSEDTEVTLEACKAFGVSIDRKGDTLRVRGSEGELHASKNVIDCKHSGTSMRFLTAFAALVPGVTKITGAGRLLERPMKELIQALKKLGVKASSEREGIMVHGGQLKGAHISIPGNVSSQFVSAILMIAPFAHGDVSIKIIGEFYSRPYIDITIDLMREFGAQVDTNTGNILVIRSGQLYRGKEYTIERDYSSAQYWFAAAAVTGSSVTVRGLSPDSAQGDKAILDLLTQMGCLVERDGDGVTLSCFKQLQAINIDGSDIPDLVPTLAVMGAFAEGVTRIQNVAHLRMKESDRLAVSVEELKKMGVTAIIQGDSIEIEGGEVHGAKINTHNDHRIAMAFAVAALGAEGETTIQNAEVVKKSYPEFWNDLAKLGVTFQKV